MHIIFGMDMDGAAWSHKEASLGEICCGPAGMLSLLEGRLGLDGVKATFPERINDYRQKIDAVRPSWCKASFSLDPWCTARQLLTWRDALVMSGWDGKAGTSERLEAMAAIEGAARPLAPGEPDRLKKVLTALSGFPLTGKLELTTSKKHLPFLWQKAVESLEASGMAVIDSSRPRKCSAECIRVTAPNEMTLARDVARYLAAAADNTADNSNVAVIAEGDTRLLDGFLRQYGFGKIGRTQASRWRESLQILPLWLDLLWKPFNPTRFLELITLPVSPIRPSVSRMLANVLRKTPGIGSAEWNDAWKEFLERVRKNEQGYYGNPEEEISKVQALRDFLEHQCFKAEKTVPGTSIIGLCDQMTNRLGVEAKEHPAIGMAISHAATLKKLIDSAGEYDRITLARMLDSIIGSGTQENVTSEVTPFDVYSRPGAVRQAYKTIIWWNFVTQAPADNVYWTPDEIKAVPGLVPVESERAAEAWHRAVGFAEERIIAFTPGRRAGEEAFAHPLADEISFKEMPSESLTDENGLWKLGDRTLQLQPLQSQNTHTDCAISISPNSIVPQRRLSYSQMSTLLACPFRWFLDDYIGLKQPSVLALPTGPQMIGTLAHKVVERLYKDTEPLDPETAERSAGKLFDELVPQMAAELLLDGRNVEKTRIKATLQRSIRELVSGINERDLLVKTTEKKLSGTFLGMKFIGYSDIYLEGRDGNAFVIDMKWSDSKKYKDMVESHKALQLAAYAWLLRPEDFKVECAYYQFPKFEFHQKRGEDWGDIWEQATALWKQRMETLHGGRLELGDPDNDRQLVKPDCEYCEYASICGREVK